MYSGYRRVWRLRMKRETLTKMIATIAVLAVSSETMAYKQAFTKTPVDEIQVRTLPGGRWISTNLPGEYFSSSGRLFTQLFDYIRDNDVSMTVPVEGDITRAEMRFYIGTDNSAMLAESDKIKLIDVPSRRVVSVGGRGSYSKSNIEDAHDILDKWMVAQSNWAPAGPPYAVYWNGPFTTWFMKRFEVHIPIEPSVNE